MNAKFGDRGKQQLALFFFAGNFAVRVLEAQIKGGAGLSGSLYLQPHHHLQPHNRRKNFAFRFS
jgi:hypothetical protein